MKHTFSHVIAFQGSTDKTLWVDQAAVCMHADALVLARHISELMPNTIVRVEDQLGNYVNIYLKAGCEVAGPEMLEAA